MSFSDPLGLEPGNLYQRGYSHYGNNRGDSHWYEVETLICSLNNLNCNKNNVAKALKLYPAPLLCLTPGCRQPIKSGDVSYAFPVGKVIHTVCDYLVINTTIQGQHKLVPGVVMREVVEKEGNIYINTLGFGTGNLGAINTQAAQYLWNSVDKGIIFSIKRLK